MKETLSKGKKYLKGKGLLRGSVLIENIEGIPNYKARIEEELIRVRCGLQETGKIYIVVDKGKGNIHLNYQILRECEAYKIYAID